MRHQKGYESPCSEESMSITEEVREYRKLLEQNRNILGYFGVDIAPQGLQWLDYDREGISSFSKDNMLDVTGCIVDNTNNKKNVDPYIVKLTPTSNAENSKYSLSSNFIQLCMKVKFSSFPSKIQEKLRRYIKNPNEIITLKRETILVPMNNDDERLVYYHGVFMNNN